MRKIYTFKQDLKESLKDPEFRRAWKDSEPEWKRECAAIEKRLTAKPLRTLVSTP